MNFKSLIAAIPLAIASLGAGAVEITLSPTSPGSFSGSFTQMANGLVIDDYSFAPLAFDSTVSVTLTSLSGPVSFLTALFFPDTASEIPFQNLTNDVGGEFSFAAPIEAGTPLTLRVFGAVTDATGNLGGDGAYRVSVMAAVPEPATVALLLGGLGVVGLATRRRRA